RLLRHVLSAALFSDRVLTPCRVMIRRNVIWHAKVSEASATAPYRDIWLHWRVLGGHPMSIPPKDTARIGRFDDRSGDRRGRVHWLCGGAGAAGQGGRCPRLGTTDFGHGQSRRSTGRTFLW